MKIVYKLLITLSLVLFIGNLVSAQTKEEEPEEIVVTADRVQQNERELIDAHTIITRKEIEQTGYQTVEEILRNQAGVDISRSGGKGRLTGIHIRGTNSDAGTLILLDGVNLMDVNDNSFPDLQNISLESVERIEIIRGSQASLYGYSAAGGVINIITRKGKGKKSTLISNASVGSHKMHEFGLGMLTNSDDYQFFFYSTYSDTNGYIKPRDGAKNKSIIFSGSFKPTPLSKLSIVGQYSDSMIQLYKDGGLPETNDYRSNRNNAVFGINYQRLFWDFYEPDIRLNYKTFNNHATSGFGTSIYNTDAFAGSFQNNFHIAKGKDILTLGFEYGHEEYRTSFSGTSTGVGVSRNNKSIFLSNLFRFIPRLYVNTSARVDLWESTYDWKDTFTNLKGGVAYHIIDKGDIKNNIISLLKIRSSISKVKSPPTYMDIGFIANPKSVNAESYLSFDVGLDIYFLNNKAQLSGSYFHYNVESFLYWDPAAGAWGEMKNGGKGKIDGIELEIKGQLPVGFAIKGSYTHNKISITNVTDTKQLNTRRPKHKALANLNWNYFKPLNMNINWLWVGNRKDIDTSTYPSTETSLSSYHIVDLAVSYKIINELTILGKVNNVTDKSYEDPNMFRQDGRNWFIGLKLSLPLN
ncbi:MAG: TonB-dependent receptor [Spirochaetota bacterium]|nr:TonB-dependent receptor [Spirochaetota bacterium]